MLFFVSLESVALFTFSEVPQATPNTSAESHHARRT